MERLSRGAKRSMLLAALAAATPLESKAQTPGHIPERAVSTEAGIAGQSYLETSRSLLSALEIAAQRDAAIDILLAELPRAPQLTHLRDAERLRAESQAYNPDPVELNRISSRASEPLKTLDASLPVGGYGLLALADVVDEIETHRLYVVEKATSGRLHLIKAYRVSLAENGFGNAASSGMTPLGLFWINNWKEGSLGEVIPVINKHTEYFKHVYEPRPGHKRYFVSDFGHETITEPAAVITDRYTIDGSRGIHLHGSNRTGRWRFQPDGSRLWHSFLDGVRRSGACGRMANADIRDLGRNFIQKNAQRADMKKGTPIFFHATPAVLMNNARK